MTDARTRKPKPTDVLTSSLIMFARDGPLSPADIEAAMCRFKKAMQRAGAGGELTHHLGYPPGGTQAEATTNHRNGTSGNTVLTDDGSLHLEVPRDREGTFAPQLIPKHARRFTGFDDESSLAWLTVRESRFAECSAEVRPI